MCFLCTIPVPQLPVNALISRQPLPNRALMRVRAGGRQHGRVQARPGERMCLLLQAVVVVVIWQNIFFLRCMQLAHFGTSLCMRYLRRCLRDSLWMQLWTETCLTLSSLPHPFAHALVNLSLEATTAAPINSIVHLSEPSSPGVAFG